MLKTKQVEIKLNAKTIKHYWKLGYKGTTNEIITVKIEHLNVNSHYKVCAVCDNCNKEKLIPYKSYIKFSKKTSYYYCHKCSMIKKIQTCRSKFGVDYSLQSKKVREKIKNTCLLKYGHSCYLETEQYLKDDLKKENIRKKNVKNGRWIAEDQIKPFLLYKRKCRTLTDKIRKQLFNNWDGFDFYDNEYIKNFLKLPYTHKHYPTIDHKISIYFGFKNNIPPFEIASLTNLCITKRFLNLNKRTKCYYETI